MAPRTIHRTVLAALALLMLAVVLPASALGAVRFDRQWAVNGNGVESAGVALDRTGSTVYIADPYLGGSGRITAYDRNGTVLRVFERATGVDVERPLGLAVDSSGNLSVFEGDRNRVLVLSPTGAVVRAVAPTGTAAFDDLASGIAIDAGDNLYVADTRNSRVEVFDAAGALVRTIALGGGFVTDLAVDAAGNVYAITIFGTAGCEAAVQKHAPDGTLLARWMVTQGSVFICARFGIGIDPRTNEVLVSSQGGSAPGVRRYSSTGAPVGAPLLGNGTARDTLKALGLAVDATGTIYVRDGAAARVLRFADLPPAPDLQSTIPSPRTITVGPATLVVPGKLSLGSLKRSKCVRTLVISTKPARVNVRIFSGIRSLRLFGAKLVVFRAAGKRVACIPVPLRAHTFDARTKLRIAVGVALNSVEGPPRPVTRPIGLVP